MYIFYKGWSMMMNSPFCSIFSKASWIITALAAINEGLGVFGKNIFATDFFIVQYPTLLVAITAIIGLAGVWSLVCFFTHGGSCK